MIIVSSAMLFGPLLVIFFYCATIKGEVSPVTKEFIKTIKSKAKTWQAGRNFHPDTSKYDLQRIMGVHRDAHRFGLAPKVDYTIVDPSDIPKHFDSRDKWRKCPSISRINYQGSCGSSWAISAADAMTDRYCIHSNQTKHFQFSIDDLVSCCHSCGFECDGGFPGEAWSYWTKKGLCSGSWYQSHSSCFPYSIAPCNYDDYLTNDICEAGIVAPKCNKTCQPDYEIAYKDDKKFGETVYSLGGDAAKIQHEIMINGPVQAIFTVYEDLVSYKSGVYRHVHGEMLGLHAIRIIGWGVEDATPYWLVANSWNTDWGDYGFFKILRGKNHCGIEDQISAGIPKY